jgi:predicted acylesterase/phospholipase RssA
MARIRSALPWGVLLLFGALFLLSWWIEDRLIYADWSDVRAFRIASLIVTRLGLDLAVRPIANTIWLAGHFLSTFLARIDALIARAFSSLPLSLRTTPALRLFASFEASLANTFGGDSAMNFGAGLLRLIEKLIKVIIALNGAAWIYNIGRRLGRLIAAAVYFPARLRAERGVSGDLFDSNDNHRPVAEARRRREYAQFLETHVKRIGIVLAGGGASGAYQAGALKAIHEFLRDYDALDKVAMVAGTSIGAWNAMFWMAGMIESPDLKRPSLETWWKTIRFRRLLEFRWFYVPFWSSSLLRTTPWRESFAKIFRGRLEQALSNDPPVHFYLTRTDVGEAVLKYTTNWQGIAARLDQLGLDQDDDYRFFDVIEPGKDATRRAAQAVFASMDLPPAFPHMNIGADVFEDGGVLENLPIRFGAPIEDCDLLFVLPLHASFKRTRERHSLLKRVLRVGEIRQGMLELAALRNVDTINRFAQRVERLDFGVNAMATDVSVEGVAAEALTGIREEIPEFNEEYKQLYVFSIVPRGELEIGTFGFWKRRAAADAFDLMYLQTRRELQNRLFEDIEPEDPRVVLVDGQIPTGKDLPKPQYKRPAQL